MYITPSTIYFRRIGILPLQSISFETLHLVTPLHSLNFNNRSLKHVLGLKEVTMSRPWLNAGVGQCVESSCHHQDDPIDETMEIQTSRHTFVLPS